MKDCYVITNVEMGWDCVCGVYETIEGVVGCFEEFDNEYFDQIEELTDEEEIIRGLHDLFDVYVIHKQTIQ